MLFNLTAILQFIMGVVSSTASLALYLSYLRRPSDKSEVLKLATFFTLFAFYSFSHSIPFILFPNSLRVAGWGFIGAITIVLLMILVLFQTKVFYLNPLIKKIRPFFVVLVVVSGIFIISIMISDFRLPVIDKSGYVFWNVNRIAIWSFSAITAFTALLFSFAYFDSARFTQSIISRIKAYILSLDGIIWAIAVILYFPSSNPSQISFAIAITIFSLVLAAFVFWVPKLFSDK